MVAIVFVFNFLLTALIEGTIIFLLYKKRRFVYYSLLCNMLTNPALNLLLMLAVKTFGQSAYYLSLAVLETLAVLVEAYVLKLLGDLTPSKALTVSFLLNAVSFLVGLILYSLMFR